MNDLIIKTSPNEVVFALLRNKKLIELHHEGNNQDFTVGDLYLGRVKKLVSGLNAAFIDVGYEKDGFLHYHDLGPQVLTLQDFVQRSITGKQTTSNLRYSKGKPDIDKNGQMPDVLSPGQNILVQIEKEPISTKGPRISCEISIPGRYLVLVPFSDRVSVSQKITNREEKDRLKRLIQSIKPKNFGVIIRTNAENVKVAELDADLRDLQDKWKFAYDNLKSASPPKKILGEISKASALMRDILNEESNSIWVDSHKLYEEIKSYLEQKAPDKVKILKFYKGRVPIFDHFGIEKQIKSAFGKMVTMRSGAYLVIEHTEALHVVDVNSGNRSKNGLDQETNALETNLEAADEIARQLRLRDMGGIIVVDFIDMKRDENRKALFHRIKEAMKDDRAKHSILPPSRFGLIEITRQRVRPATQVITAESCPTCQGTGEIQASILLVEEIYHALTYLIKDQNKKKLTLQLHPFVEAYLKQGFPSRLMKWKFDLGKKFSVRSSAGYDLLEYRFFDSDKEEIVL